MASLNTIIGWFLTRKKPTAQQFEETWRSFWHKNDDIITMNDVQNLTNTVNTLQQQINTGTGKEVWEFDTHGDFPVSGAANAIYIAKDDDVLYRWADTQYVPIGGGADTLSDVTFRGNRSLMPLVVGPAPNTASNFGIVNGENAIATGYAANAAGKNVLASGNQSFANGLNTTAAGHNSFASGVGATANGLSSTALGAATANGDDSLAIGEGAVSRGYSSFAQGQESEAIGDYSHAEGMATRAAGLAGHAEGLNTLAQNESDHAEGDSTVASGNASHAEGLLTQATGNGSHAEGSDTIAEGAYSHAEGMNSVSTATASHAGGKDSLTRHQGEMARASGAINEPGDAQTMFLDFTFSGSAALLFDGLLMKCGTDDFLMPEGDVLFNITIMLSVVFGDGSWRTVTQMHAVRKFSGAITVDSPGALYDHGTYASWIELVPGAHEVLVYLKGENVDETVKAHATFIISKLQF